MSSNENSNDQALAQVQNITLNILLQFRKICGDLGLKYYLAYGTLLGAVRHKGFIPWDDDIDVWMPRSDYMLLLEYLSSINKGRYRLCMGQLKPPGEWPEELQMKFIDTDIAVERYYGNEIIESYPWIDIFALDNVEDNHLSFEKRFKRRRFFYQVCRCKSFLIKANGIFGKANAVIYFLHNKHHLLKHIMNEQKSTRKMIDVILSENAENQDSDTLFCNAAVYIPKIQKCFFEKAWFSQTHTLKFEGYDFPVPGEYEKVLEKIYGNYMEMPPVEKRTGSHFGKILKT